MNGLTVNLHLLMLAFYKPEGMRRKILIEDHAFPSDRYAVRSLLRVKGVRISQFIMIFHHETCEQMDEDCLVLVRPRPGEDTIRTEDIVDLIRREGPSLALVMLSGVQYYTGQKFQMDVITREGHAAGAKVRILLRCVSTYQQWFRWAGTWRMQLAMSHFTSPNGALTLPFGAHTNI